MVFLFLSFFVMKFATSILILVYFLERYLDIRIRNCWIGKIALQRRSEKLSLLKTHLFWDAWNDVIYNSLKIFKIILRAVLPNLSSKCRMVDMGKGDDPSFVFVSTIRSQIQAKIIYWIHRQRDILMPSVIQRNFLNMPFLPLCLCMTLPSKNINHRSFTSQVQRVAYLRKLRSKNDFCKENFT